MILRPEISETSITSAKKARISLNSINVSKKNNIGAKKNISTIEISNKIYELTMHKEVISDLI